MKNGMVKCTRPVTGWHMAWHGMPLARWTQLELEKVWVERENNNFYSLTHSIPPQLYNPEWSPFLTIHPSLKQICIVILINLKLTIGQLWSIMSDCLYPSQMTGTKYPAGLITSIPHSTQPTKYILFCICFSTGERRKEWIISGFINTENPCFPNTTPTKTQTNTKGSLWPSCTRRSLLFYADFFYFPCFSCY